MNNVVIIGNLVKDPEFKIVGEHDKAVFTIAVSRNKNTTDFIPVVAWDNTAQVANKYLKKGYKCAICGSINVENYKSADGNIKNYTCVIAKEIVFMFTKDNDWVAGNDFKKM